MTKVEKQLKAILEEALREVKEDVREIKEKLTGRRRRGEPPEWVPRFLKALTVTGCVTKAIELIGQPRSSTTYYRYRNSCPDFAVQWDAAREAHRRRSAASKAVAAPE